MIYQPRNIQPSYKSIDGTINNVFSMEVNTNMSITAYKLIILTYQNESFYNGDKVLLNEPIYNGEQLFVDVPSTIGLVNGYDYKWRLRLYQDETDMLITYGVVSNTSTTTEVYIQSNINIKSDMFLKIGSDIIQILNYDINSGLITLTSALSGAPTVGTSYQILSDFIETIPDNIVYIRENATVSITNVPVSLDKKYYNFIGNYTQSDNVPPVYFIWNLYLVVNNGRELIYTTDKIYSANIKFSYDGFKTGQSYQIELFVETEYGIVVSSGLQTFDVQYASLEYLQQPTASFVLNKNAIQIDWTTPTNYEPSVSSSIQKLMDTPYLRTNSAFTGNGIISYNNGELLMGEIPDLYRITTQFRPNFDFYYNYSNIYNSMIPVFNIYTDDLDGAKNISVFIHGYKVVAITPTLSSGVVDFGTLSTAPEGEENNETHVFLDKVVNLEKQQYITFPNYEYTEKIISFDSETNMIEFDKPLPFIPEESSVYYLNDTLSTDFYTNINNTFALQASSTTSPLFDYIWMDSFVWPSAENELSYYWLEGGTETGRIVDYWWKLELTNTSIKLEKGGV